ncbi:MAG: hypothetical protein AB1938_20450 [Myxococcota bacterium]
MAPLLVSLLAVSAQLAVPDAGGIPGPRPSASGVPDGGLAPVELEFRGMAVLPAEVYRAVITLPKDAKADLATLESVVAQTESFLRRSGYELAHVGGSVEGNRLVLDISEGELEKIVFKGRLTFQMIRFKLAFVLARDVFNRAEVERQLQTLAKQLDVEPPAWELVPTENVRHVGPQLENLGDFSTIQGFALVKPQRRYELHLSFATKEWSTGLGLDIRISYFDGVELGVNYQGKGLLFDDDRWRTAVMAGVGVRQDILNNDFYLFPSRVFIEGQYYTPAFAKYVRSFVWLTAEGLARQRKDPELRLENYYSEDARLSLNIQVQPSEKWKLFIGMGFQQYYLGGYQSPPGEPPPMMEEVFRWRGFVQLGGDILFGLLSDGRWDRRHQVSLDSRLWGNLQQLSTPTFWEVHGLYQKVFAFGWHDLWLKARGDALGGDVLFPFEVPLGEYLRGNFGDVFVRLGAGGRAEFRFSLTRDLYKLGFFVDTVGYGEIDRTLGTQTPRFGVAFGPGFHALVVGMFQLDMNVSFGVLSTGRFNTGVFASLIKAY